MLTMKAKSSHRSLDTPDSFLQDGHNDNMTSLSLIGKEDSGIYVFGTSLEGSVYKTTPETTQQKLKSNNNIQLDDKNISCVTSTYLQNLRRNSQEPSSLLSHHSIVDREGRSSLEGSLFMENYNQKGYTKDDSNTLSKIFDKDDSYIFGSVEGSHCFPSPRQKIVQGTTVCIIGDIDDSDNNSEDSECSLFNKPPYNKNSISKSCAKREISNPTVPNKNNPVRHLMPETEQFMIQKNKYPHHQGQHDSLVGLHYSLAQEQSRIDYDKKKQMKSKALNERISSSRSNNYSSSSEDHPISNDTPSRRKSSCASNKKTTGDDDISTGSSSIRSENRRRAAAKASSIRKDNADDNNLVGVSSSNKKSTNISQSEQRQRSTKNSPKSSHRSKNDIDTLPFSNLIISTSPKTKSSNNNNDRKSSSSNINNNIPDSTLVCNDESSVSSLEDFTSRPRRTKTTSSSGTTTKKTSSTSTATKKTRPSRSTTNSTTTKVLVEGIPLSIALGQIKQTDDASISSKTLPKKPMRSSSPH